MAEESIYQLKSQYQPAGDQEKSIAQIISYLKDNHKYITLHGITGSGKTFTMANVIAQSNRPAVIYSPNKILAYQLYEEFRSFFPNNAVHYYVSSFDFYLPEFVKNGEYHTKQSQKNDILEQMILETMNSLVLKRKDLIIVTSSACLFGTGSPEMYSGSVLRLSKDKYYNFSEFKTSLLAAGYVQVNGQLRRGDYIVKGKRLEICTSSFEDIYTYISITFDADDYIQRITRTKKRLIPLEEILEQMPNLEQIAIFPATRFAHGAYTSQELEIIVNNIRGEKERQKSKLSPDKYYFLDRKVEDDIHSIIHYGYCNGIENYAWYFNRANLELEFQPEMYYTNSPYTMMSYLSEDTMIFIDESHLAIGQIQGAHHSDFSRKQDLINEGIRLPSCVINRPLKYEEFDNFSNQVIYISATPGERELFTSQNRVVQQFIRPTFLLDPEVIVYDDQEIGGISRRAAHIIAEVQETIKQQAAVLLRMSNSLAAEHMVIQLKSYGIKAATMLAANSAPERRELVERLQGVSDKEQLDVIVGVNLIREGLDIPRVAKVILADVDVAGFLNDARSLIQVIGRAARNVNGKCIIYTHDKKNLTPQVIAAIEQTAQRRKLQQDYNIKYHKQPITAQANSFKHNKFRELVDDTYNHEIEDIKE